MLDMDYSIISTIYIYIRAIDTRANKKIIK